LYVMVVVVRHH